MAKVNSDFIYAVNRRDLKSLRNLINEHGLNSTEAHGYVLLRESIKKRGKEITKLLLNSGSRVNSKRSKTIASNTPLHFAIENGDLEITQLLLDHGADIDARNESGASPLLIAIQRKKENIIDLLLHRGPILYSCNKGLSPLHVAVENRLLSVIEKLLQIGAPIDSKANCYSKNNFTPLHCATSNGDFAIVEVLLKNGASVNSKTAEGLTPLHLACKKGYVQIIELLLKSNADINARAENSSTPLYLAVDNSHREAAKFLMEHGAKINDGASVNSKTAEGLTPLHLACKKGNVEIIELLLKSNADINARSENSFTPLYLAVDNSHREAAKFLMEHGAKINDDFENGKTILSLAVNRGSSIIVEDVLQYLPDINNAINKNSFKIAVRKSDGYYFPIVESLLKYGFSVEPDDINDTALLHNAIKKGYSEIIKDLIKHGLDLTCSNEENRIILHIAQKNKQFQVAKLLLTHGADVDATDKSGKPPIFCSTQNSDVNMTKLLLLHGADVRKCPELLRVATNKVCKEIVEILLEHKVDIEASDKFGRTALHLAASYEYEGLLELFHQDESPETIKSRIEITKLLLIKGANVNAKTLKDGFSALHFACGKEFVNIVEVLLEYKADIESVAKGCRPLHIAAQKGNATIIGMLLENRANINSKQDNGNTALHIAAQKGHTNALKILLKNGADVYSKNNMDDTPLHVAVTLKETDAEIVSILLKHMSPIDSKNKDGNTPLHIATTLGRGNIIKTLLYFGSDINMLDQNNCTAIDLANLARYSYPLDHYLEEYEEYYETYNEHLIMNVLQDLLLHAITLKAANLYTGKKDLYSYLDNNFLRLEEEECKNEIEKLKLDKIANSKLSSYDILTKSIHSLASYTRNEDVIRIFKSDCYKTKFPIYESFIRRNFEKATQRRQLLDRAHEFFKFYFEIPYECVDQILSYLNNVDLENVIDLWKMQLNLETPDL